MTDPGRIDAMRSRPVVERLRVGLRAYEELEDEFRWAARRGARPSELERALELCEDLQRRAVTLGALSRQALGEVMVRDRPQQTVRILGDAAQSHVDLPELAARDWIDVDRHHGMLDRVVHGPQPPVRVGRRERWPQTAHGDDFRDAAAAALVAEIDVAGWLSHVLRQVLALRGSSPDVFVDGRPPTEQARALYLLAGAAPPRRPGDPPAPRPLTPMALAAEPHTERATFALATATEEEYDLAAWVAHQLLEVLATRDQQPGDLVSEIVDLPHAVAWLRLLERDA